MALTTSRFIAENPTRYVKVVRSGSRTAADFTVDLGFNPQIVQVTNLTDRITAQWDNVSGNSLQLLTVAAGTRTYASAGLAVANRVLTVTVATAGLETDNDVVLIEAWG